MSDPTEPPVQLVKTDLKVFPARPVKKEIRVTKGRQDHAGCKARRELKVQSALRVSRVRGENKEFPGLKVSKESKVRQEPKAIKDRWVKPVPQVLPSGDHSTAAVPTRQVTLLPMKEVLMSPSLIQPVEIPQNLTHGMFSRWKEPKVRRVRLVQKDLRVK